MAFGKNPHVAKAEAAQLKAQDAKDANAEAHAWREAARLWERAASREPEGKRRAEYTANAERARATADGEAPAAELEDAPVHEPNESMN
jgi:hypothetical protein